jgi:signal transduction histidine kinase
MGDAHPRPFVVSKIRSSLLAYALTLLPGVLHHAARQRAWRGAMSVAAQAPSDLSSRPRFRPRPSQLYFWLVSLAWMAVLGWGLLEADHGVLSKATALTPWVLLLAVVNLLPLTTWQHAYFTADVPITIAAMLVLSPIEAGLVTFLGTLDPREFRGQVPLAKALFNRSQIALAVFVGSLAAHAIVTLPAPSPFVLLLAGLVLALMSSTNYVLAGIGISFEHGYSVGQALQRMKVGSLPDFLLTLVSWGVLGAMLAALYDLIGLFALVAFLAPTLLGRQTLDRSQMSIDTARAYRSREAALAQISNQIYEERTDERRLIAADLHDEVLQPLFKVTLMAQVLKTDLASGHLLEMDQDLPELLTAADLASSTLRDLIGDLRRSALGRDGLPPALMSLIRSTAQQTPIKVHADVGSVRLEPDAELVVYQIAKEALGNAITHSTAANVWVQLANDSEAALLSIRDDGTGFDPLHERAGHYGIAIMKERASAIGANLYIDSWPGRGTKIELTIRSNRYEP